MEEHIISYFKKHKTIKEFLRYICVGGICTIIDISVLYIIVDFLGINYIFASAISFTLGVIINYFLCTTWIFDVRLIDNRYKEFSIYVFISLVGLLINTLSITLITELFGLHFIISKILSTGITLVWNFTGRKFILHSKYAFNLIKNKE